jgi:hypothetical protein
MTARAASSTNIAWWHRFSTPTCADARDRRGDRPSPERGDGSGPAETFGFLGQILVIDQPASGAQTRELLGWRPAQPGLIEDLDMGHYFG